MLSFAAQVFELGEISLQQRPGARQEGRVHDAQAADNRYENNDDRAYTYTCNWWMAESFFNDFGLGRKHLDDGGGLPVQLRKKRAAEYNES